MSSQSQEEEEEVGQMLIRAKQKGKIRFSIWAAFAATVAERLGYDPETAKSMGLARATFYAWGKNGGRSRREIKKTGKALVKHQNQEKEWDVEVVNFAGNEIYLVETPEGLRAIYGNQIQDPKRFDDYCIRRRLGEENWPKIKALFEKLLSFYTDAQINTLLPYKLYEQFRPSDEENNEGIWDTSKLEQMIAEKEKEHQAAEKAITEVWHEQGKGKEQVPSPHEAQLPLRAA